MSEDKKHTLMMIIAIIVMTTSLAVLMLGCTTTGRTTKYEVDCNECKFKMSHNIDSDEFKKGF